MGPPVALTEKMKYQTTHNTVSEHIVFILQYCCRAKSASVGVAARLCAQYVRVTVCDCGSGSVDCSRQSFTEIFQYARRLRMSLASVCMCNLAVLTAGFIRTVCLCSLLLMMGECHALCTHTKKSIRFPAGWTLMRVRLGGMHHVRCLFGRILFVTMLCSIKWLCIKYYTTK